MEDPCPYDLWVMYSRTGERVDFHIEVKNPETQPKHLRSSYKDSQWEALQKGWPIHVVETPEEALAIVTGRSAEALEVVDNTPRRGTARREQEHEDRLQAGFRKSQEENR